MLYEILQAQIRAARLVHNPETLRDPFRENFCKQSDKSKNFRGQIWLAFAREERTKYEEHVCTYGNLCCHLVATAELCTSGSNEEDELKFRANFISLRHQEEKFVRKKKPLYVAEISYFMPFTKCKYEDPAAFTEWLKREQETQAQS